jgi:hypothetical protein
MNEISGSQGSEDDDVGFWIVMPCGLVGRYQRFERTFSLPKRWYLPASYTAFYNPEDQHRHVIKYSKADQYEILLAVLIPI